MQEKLELGDTSKDFKACQLLVRQSNGKFTEDNHKHSLLYLKEMLHNLLQFCGKILL